MAPILPTKRDAAETNDAIDPAKPGAKKLRTTRNAPIRASSAETNNLVTPAPKTQRSTRNAPPGEAETCDSKDDPGTGHTASPTTSLVMDHTVVTEVVPVAQNGAEGVWRLFKQVKEIGENAKRNELCNHTLELFVGVYGRDAGNAMLKAPSCFSVGQYTRLCNEGLVLVRVPVREELGGRVRHLLLRAGHAATLLEDGREEGHEVRVEVLLVLLQVHVAQLDLLVQLFLRTSRICRGDRRSASNASLAPSSALLGAVDSTCATKRPTPVRNVMLKAVSPLPTTVM
ncbi:hypothetical protein PF007_g18237 [Phytophthora fragariae]|uniref:Uncharacterized protein n=3 Tax=Phytophthora TaxID=4783 RepID=A0A6A3RAH8_9STRA|nr:hypothetical protein PF007_g18237 [Phytophthora fragariae]KAE9206124.1 hypothetical protein PF004_g17388 [Phytophthora fragariae]